MVYVGKTERELNVRYNEHIRDYRNRVGMCSSYKIIECEEVSIELIEETETEDREKYWIAELNSCNDRTYDFDKKGYQESYYKQNQEKFRLAAREYTAKNRDKINSRLREKRNKNKDELNRIRREKYAAKKSVIKN